MKETWNNPTDIRCDLPQDRVAQLLEERGALMAKVREIDGIKALAVQGIMSDVRRANAIMDAEREGRLLILPCKVGDTVWDRKVEPWNVISVEWFSKKVTRLHCESPVTAVKNTFSIGKRSLGKTVFLTRAEAEAALRGGTSE